MVAVDFYRPEQWTNFYIMVGGGAAALTGLVFVAMSLNLTAIVKDPTHRYRARGTLAGFLSVFMICGLALMGNQSHKAVGLEWLAVAVAAAAIYIEGVVRAKTIGKSFLGLGTPRIIVGTGIYLAEIIGAISFALGHKWGLYVAAVSLVVLLGYTISGAWLLVIGVHEHNTKR